MKALEAARLGGDVVTTEELRTLLALAARGDRGYVDTIAVGPDRHLVLPAGAPNGRGNPVATRTRGGSTATHWPHAARLAQTLRAIADPTRLRLLSMVAAHDSGEACVCDLTEPLDLTQPTVSHRLKVLVHAGLLTRDKRGVVLLLAGSGALDALAAVLSSSSVAANL